MMLTLAVHKHALWLLDKTAKKYGWWLSRTSGSSNTEVNGASKRRHIAIHVSRLTAIPRCARCFLRSQLLLCTCTIHTIYHFLSDCRTAHSVSRNYSSHSSFAGAYMRESTGPTPDTTQKPMLGKVGRAQVQCAIGCSVTKLACCACTLLQIKRHRSALGMHRLSCTALDCCLDQHQDVLRGRPMRP